MTVNRMSSASTELPKILKDTSDIDLVIQWLNAQDRGLLFVCYGCNDIVRGEGLYLPISKWDECYLFCDSCVIPCVCGDDYVPSMSYQHEGCEEFARQQEKKTKPFSTKEVKTPLPS
jgi:hypothetical protein